MISWPFIVYFCAVILLTATMLVISHLLNPKISNRKNLLPFESGIVPQGSTDLRWTVNYFLVAILFVIFDMEAVFLYVWAIVVLETGWPAFFATTIFIGVLLIALIYEWRMGVLEWGKKLQPKTDNAAHDIELSNIKDDSPSDNLEIPHARPQSITQATTQATT